MANGNKSAFKPALDFKPGQLALTLEIIASQKHLQCIVKKALPAALAEHVQHCVQSGKKLIIYTEAACWAAQIRFYHEAIVNELKTSSQLNINTLQVRLLAQFAEPINTQSKKLPSNENIDQIYELGVNNAKNDLLKTSLQKLAETLAKRKGIVL